MGIHCPFQVPVGFSPTIRRVCSIGTRAAAACAGVTAGSGEPCRAVTGMRALSKSRFADLRHRIEAAHQECERKRSTVEAMHGHGVGARQTGTPAASFTISFRSRPAIREHVGDQRGFPAKARTERRPIGKPHSVLRAKIPHPEKAIVTGKKYIYET